MQSYEQDGRVVETPHLNIAYRPRDWSDMRENGATWQVITADTPQPTGFSPRSFAELQSRGER